MSGKELLTADEAAELLKVTKRTLLKWARLKQIESVRLSRKSIHFSKEAIDEFVQKKTHGVKSQTPKARRKGQTKPSPKSKKRGGDKKTSGKMWSDLRKEVYEWQ